jgi:hypothetical protein
MEPPPSGVERGVEHRAPRRARIRAALLSEPAIVVGLVILSWPVSSTLIKSDLDGSWQLALHLAIQRGLHFGSDIVFSYGPLGFLTVPWPWLGLTTLAALLLAGTLQVALCLVALRAARRFLPLWAAIVVAYLAGRAFTVFEASEAILALLIAACLVALTRNDPLPPRRATAIRVVAGVVVGAAMLGKLSAGVFAPLLVGVTTLGLVRPWYRGLAILVPVAVATTLGIWLVTGQRLADIPPFLAGSFEIIRGYSETMGADRNPALYLYVVAYVAGALTLAWLVTKGGLPADRRRRIALVIVAAIAAFAFYKIEVVRWGIGYAMGAELVAILAITRPPVRAWQFGAALAVVFVPIATLSVGAPLQFLTPIDSLKSGFVEARVVLQPWRWSADEVATIEQLRKRYDPGASIIAAIGDHTVHADPWQAGVFAAWPELRWRPIPIFQTYSAYTAALDELDAALLRGRDAPERILRRAAPASAPAGSGPPTIDHRYGWFEAPAAMLESFCRYDEIAAAGGWEVLALTQRRCGAPELLTSATSATTGEVVPIPVDPRPDRIVIVRIGGLRTLVDSVVTPFFKAPEWYITIDGGSPYRLVAPTAGDGLLLAVPDSIARTGAFSFGPPRSTVSVARRDGGVQQLTYSFYSIPLVVP